MIFSVEDRCNRFLDPVSEVSPELLQQLTHVDYANHLALIAETFKDGEQTVIVRRARSVRAGYRRQRLPSRSQGRGETGDWPGSCSRSSNAVQHRRRLPDRRVHLGQQ